MVVALVQGKRLRWRNDLRSARLGAMDNDTGHRLTVGAALLRAWLDDEDLSQAELARRAGVDPGLICRYLSGEMKPELKNALAIEEATGGVVAPKTWLEAA